MIHVLDDTDENRNLWGFLSVHRFRWLKGSFGLMFSYHHDQFHEKEGGRVFFLCGMFSLLNLLMVIRSRKQWGKQHRHLDFASYFQVVLFSWNHVPIVTSDSWRLVHYGHRLSIGGAMLCIYKEYIRTFIERVSQYFTPRTTNYYVIYGTLLITLWTASNGAECTKFSQYLVSWPVVSAPSTVWHQLIWCMQPSIACV